MFLLGFVLFCMQQTFKVPSLPQPLPSVKTEQEKKRCEELKARIGKVKEWHKPTDYTPEDWVYLLKLAQSVQKMPENIVSEAMNSFHDIDTRPYLLLKVMFYRPLSNAGDYFGPSAGAIIFTEQVREKHSYDIPIDWSKGYPRLVGSRYGGTGRGAGFRYDYLVLRRCYSLRKITIPRQWKQRAKRSPGNASPSKLKPARN